MLFRLKAFLLLLPSIHAATLPPEFADPSSPQVDHVNPLIGNGGDTPNGSGGMIPSTAPPFAMTRWVAQTRENYVSMTPYNSTDDSVHGFQGTHQPAIWMGESGNVAVVPGSGDVKSRFKDRGMKFIERETREVLSPSYYAAYLDLNGGALKAEQSASKYHCQRPRSRKLTSIVVFQRRVSVIYDSLLTPRPRKTHTFSLRRRVHPSSRPHRRM